MERNNDNLPQSIKARLLMNYVFIFIFLIVLFTRGYGRLWIREYLIIGVFIIIWAIITFITKPNVINFYKESFEEIKVTVKTEIRWKDIKLVQFLKDDVRRRKGMYLNFVYQENDNFHISLKDYSRKNIRILCEAIVKACPHADISDKIRNMAEGKFPWHIF